MYRTILVPLDGSERAEAILSQVEELATAMKSKVVLMRVVEPAMVASPTHDAWASSYLQDFDRQISDSRSYLIAMVARIESKGLQAEYRLMHGPVAESILQAADEVKADLIALASHGRSGLGSVFYGSVAAAVLHRADRPLLLIRAR